MPKNTMPWRTFVGTAIIGLALISCGQKGDRNSALKQIASSANDELIGQLEQGQILMLNEVLENRYKYGLSEKEIEDLEANLAGVDRERVVLQYIDPNQRKGLAAPRWAWVPDEEDSKEMQAIAAISPEYDSIDTIDGTTQPEDLPYPLITLSYDERLSLPEQPVTSLYLQDATNKAEGSLMLDSIRLEDDHEPWIKGAAEIYLVVSYLDKQGQGSTEIVELPAVDHDKRDYYPRKLIHTWPKNAYQIVNVAIFEHDSGHNYASLAKAFTAAASGISTAVIDPTLTTAVAVAGVVTTLADAVIDALPSGVFTDDDDFVDNINTLEKYKNQSYGGVGGNATLGVSHYSLKVNDE